MKREERSFSTSGMPAEARMAACCCTAMATLVPVALYQTGVLGHLPDPPGAVFDSARIASSKTAHPFGVPDALLGLGSFGVTLALILLAGKRPGLRKLLGAKLAVDGGMAAFNAGRQVVGFVKLCSWCTGTAVAAMAMAVSGRNVIAEAVEWGSEK